jgi:hypothetical protein
MKKVFSFSLYDCGNYYGGLWNKYTYNTVANILIAQKLFPDWKLYVYYDNSLKSNIINFLLKSKNVVAKDMTNHWLSNCDKMMWRNLAIDDDLIDIVCIRDCDGWLSYREKVILEDWIKTDKDMHIIRDHCWHGGKIGGGLWGRKNSLKLNIEEKMKEYFTNNKSHISHSGEDQDFLTDNYYEKFKDNTVVYIGEQYDAYGRYLPRGHHPQEKDVRKINDLINYNEFIQDKSKHEIVEGLSLVEVSKLNEFKCGKCNKEFHVYIGDMFNNIPPRAIKIIEQHLK